MSIPVPASSPLTTEKHFDRHVTYLKKKEYNYSWTIYSFSEWLEEAGDRRQCSSLFPADPEYQWMLELNPEEKLEDETYCSLFLWLKVAPKAVNVKFELSMKTDDDVEIVRHSSKAFLKKGGKCGWKKFVSRETLLKQLANDVLVISSNIKAITDIKTDMEITTAQARNDLADDMESLLEGGNYGDIRIIVGDRKFLVYKGILAARSFVFAAMFNNQEMTDNTITIPDIEEAVFEELLRYIYSGRTDNLEKLAYELFAAANKYCILSLKAMCQREILAKLSVQNAAKTLELADMHRAPEMKTRVLQFLGSGAARGVTETVDWKTLITTQPHLISEAFEAITEGVDRVKLIAEN